MKENESAADNAFRDQLYNVDTSGRRVGFFPKRPKGKLYKNRSIVATILLIIFFSTPWIRIGGEPMLLLNVLERKFIIFGSIFWPQDFLLFGIFAVTFIVFIILFTVVFGRLWCGWACPQTIFLEMVYRKIEFWIEGDSAAQRRLSKADWSMAKFRKRVLKHSIFVGIAFLVSNTVLAYVIGTEQLMLYLREGPFSHLITFIVILINTGAFYFVFAWFREQACTMVCPYGRLQGVMLDSNSVVISYDYKRGEPKGKISRKAELNEEKGDCIDCKQCVAVCPTGIDIRHGTQLECVNCTACIDACDEIMVKVKRPVGLIRFASFNQIEAGEKFKFGARPIAYTVVLVGLLSVLGFLIASRTDMETNIFRAPGSMFSEAADGTISNIYTVKVVNKSMDERYISFKLVNEVGSLRIAGADSLLIPANGTANGALLLDIPAEQTTGGGISKEILVLEKGEVKEKITVRFMAPARK